MAIYGPAGTGKTQLIDSFLEEQLESHFVPLKIVFSKYSTAQSTEQQILYELQIVRVNKVQIYTPAPNRNLLVYLEDLNIPVQAEEILGGEGGGGNGNF